MGFYKLDDLLDIFKVYAVIDGISQECLLDIDYLDANLMSSIAFVSFVAELEERCGLNLESDILQDLRFRSLRGIQSIMQEQGLGK